MDDKEFTIPTVVRASQRTILPNAIKPAQLSQQTMVNTEAEILGPFTVGNGSSLSIRSIIASDTNPNYRVGSVPYCITFFQTTLSISSIIGDTITSGYTIIGPLPMAQFTPVATTTSAGGNDGYNLVFVTMITNSSGGSKTIYAITNTRTYVPTGGTAA